MSLTTSQLRFLAKRLLAKSDTEAAEMAGIAAGTVYLWKANDAEFLERYNGIFEDGIVLARDILRQHLGDAALVLAEGMAATTKGKADHQTRIRAAETMLRGLGVLSERRELTGAGGGAISLELTADDLHEAVKRATAKHGDDSSKPNGEH